MFLILEGYELPLKPITLHNVKNKDLGEILRIGRKEAKKMLNVPFVYIHPVVQQSEVNDEDVIIHVREEKRR